MKNVENWSLGYEILRPLGQVIQWFTYRTIVVKGTENIPKNDPVILAPNHQNAVMDTIAIVCTAYVQPVILGRADIFKKKLIAKILYFFKIIPVFRIRDGKDSLDKNQEIFEKCVTILKKNRCLLIYPEAAHTNIRSMLPHKKAIPRIVFQTAEVTNFEMDIKIVPVGLSFSHYYNFRRNLEVNFGKPISARDYYAEYQEQGEVKATTSLRNRIHDEIDKLIINVPDKEHYQLYHQTLEVCLPAICEILVLKNRFENFVQAGQFLTQKLQQELANEPEKLEELTIYATKYKKLKEKFGFIENVIQKGKISLAEQLKILLLVVLLIPVSLPGSILYGWLFWVTRYPARKGFKDKQFYSSIAFGLSFIAYPIWSIILFTVFWVVAFHSWIIAFLVVILSLLSGLVAWETGQLFMRMVQRRQINRGLKLKNKAMLQLFECREKIASNFDYITS